MWKEVSVTAQNLPFPLENFFVASYPEEALIFSNSKFTGSLTPDTILFLEEGVFNLTLKKRTLEDINTSVTITKDSLSSIYIDYRNYSGVLGNINIDSKPKGAQIIFDDSATGKVTPNILSNIFPGEHEIKLKFEGYWDSKTILPIESGKTIYPYITMIDSLVWVNYNLSNSGLPDLYINHTAIDKNDVKWIGTLSKRACRI
ncbi:MAG: PEGA domain-containing protein [Ignavibacteriales bacterium]|nr:PEGA domain-containing protein [Ignavibacteriales bacterium]